VFDNKMPFKLRHKTKFESDQRVSNSQSHPFPLSLPLSFISTPRLALSNNAYRHLLHSFTITGTYEVAITRSSAHVYKTALLLVEKGTIASMHQLESSVLSLSFFSYSLLCAPRFDPFARHSRSRGTAVRRPRRVCNLSRLSSPQTPPHLSFPFLLSGTTSQSRSLYCTFATVRG
jgi:hypothetical protein